MLFRQPLPDDEMGIILFELAQSRQDTVENPRPRGRPKRRPGRPRKYRVDSDDDDMDMADLGLSDDDSENLKFYFFAPFFLFALILLAKVIIKAS